MNKILFLLQTIVKKMWVRCCIFCLIGVAAIGLGPVLDPVIPDQFKEVISQSSLSNILHILASSMLAVTTFSLSIMVQALGAAANTASPRANKLLLENATAQNALGTFIGSFLFSIIGIIAIDANIYTGKIVVVLFAFTIVIITVIIVMLLKWIDQLSRLGRVSETIALVEQALKKAIVKRAKAPYLLANPFTETSLKGLKTYPIKTDDIGYIQYVDMEALNNIAQSNSLKIFIPNNAGKFYDSNIPLVCIDAEVDESIRLSIINSFVLGVNRTFEQDPRYGFVVLSEIALKAMSPALNDPGTAIAVIATCVRSVKLWVGEFACHKEQQPEIKYPNVYAKKIGEADILEDIYCSLIPVAANNLHICRHINRSFVSISGFGDGVLCEPLAVWREYLKSCCKESMTDCDFYLFES